MSPKKMVGDSIENTCHMYLQNMALLCWQEY